MVAQARRAGGWIAAASLALCCSGDDGGGGGNGSSSTASATQGSAAEVPDDDSPDDVDDSVDDGSTGLESTTGDGSTSGVDSTGADSTGEPPVEPGPVVVYVVDGDASLQLWSVDDDAGNVTQQQVYDTGPGAATLGLHPDGLHLYATARSGPIGNRVIAYSIDPLSGELTELGVTPIDLDPVYWSIDPSGSYGFSCSFGGDELGVWPINGDFTVGDTPIQTTGTPEEPHSIVPHPNGQWVYVPQRTPSEVGHYSLNAATGALTLEGATSASPGAGSRHLAIHPDGGHAYLSDEFSDSVTHLSIDGATGALTRLETLSTIPEGFDGNNNTCADVHITPDGSTVYVSNRGHDSLAMFSVDATGVLSSLGQIDTEPRPREFEVDPTGRFVFSLGQDSGMMATYTIDAESGQLQAGQVVTIGGSPLWAIAVELP